ncbi:hypothetical protein IOD06_06310 [Psychrobacter sp. N25K4-3-2]|uniref:hypothetical protein n=1 Tax=Psychrobacter sp. N25K4-3-2 TaxID=2785026 RepID=UPI00188C23CF|nr:hypothetical protein [Psychrobacter sp. N25K4-3-2]MBF4489500.1 hypothetical protein [Psychrobacter sp. N25K4-3-2]
MSLTLIAKSREINNGSEAMSSYDIKVVVLQGESAIVNNAYVTNTLSSSSVQNEADINNKVATPVLNVRNKQTSPHSSAPVCNERSGKIDITVAAQPVRVDGFDAIDDWLTNMESKAQKKWRV